MPLDNIMRNFKTNEKEMLIESMEKLIEFIYSENSIYMIF